MNAVDAERLQVAYQQSVLVVRTPSEEALLYPDLLHAGEAESIWLAIELEAEWLLMDDFRARQIAQRNLGAANLSTGIKGTLGVIVAAAQDQMIAPDQAIEFVQALKSRPDTWLAPALCEAVIRVLRRL